jgi:fructose-bisphosphate aldolase class II
LPAVNVSSSSTINAVLEAAAKNQADVIIQLSNGGAQFYAGQGMKDGFKAKVLGAVSAALHTFTCWPSTMGCAWCCTPIMPTRA